MASKKPIVRQTAWISLVPQLIVMILLVVLFGILIKPFEYALIVAMLFYLFVSNLLRNLVPRHHRKGIALYKAGNYAQAILEPSPICKSRARQSICHLFQGISRLHNRAGRL